MSLYGDIQFIKAETEYKLEHGRTAPWVEGPTKALRRRLPMFRSPAESIGSHHKHAA